MTVKLLQLKWLLLTGSLLLVAFAVEQRRPASVSAQSRVKWEYQIVKADRVESRPGGIVEVKGLSQLGEDGWEAVGMNESWILLKRSK